MKVILENGTVIDLGVTEATPTIGIVDYSRRETDEYGVTTVVQRDFARRMSVRLVVPFERTDELQRQLAAVRAKPVQWVADEGCAWLNFKGFFEDFEVDLAVPPVSYCTLTVQGLAGSEAFVDTGIDPAPAGQASSLRLLQPATINDAALSASSVAENDYPAWSAVTSYSVGARVLKPGVHRIFESAALANVGNDPTGISGKWRDIGPTNRWAMFDQALGSITSAPQSITVTLAAGMVDALALLDVVGAAVRVQAAGYDRTLAPNAVGTATFLDLPASDGPVTITVTGAGTVTVGTLLLGRLVALGQTTDSPKAGITDYSTKEVDDFGEITVVERAWAKRLSLRAMIRTDAIDMVAGRIAAVRAKPSLWIGKEGLETLTAYGFFKEFSIERGTGVSPLALSIEGLSTAGKVEPMDTLVDWPDVRDPFGTKPADNATVGAPVGTPVAGRPAEDVVDALDQLDLDVAAAKDAVTAISQDADDLRGTLEAAQADIVANGQGIQAAQQTLGEHDTVITSLQAVAENQAGSLAQLSDTVTAQGSSVSELLTASETQAGQIAAIKDTVVTDHARVDTVVEALSTAEEGIAAVRQSVETQGASIETVQQAVSTLDEDLALVRTEVRSGSEPNLIKYGDFPVANTGWTGSFTWYVGQAEWGNFVGIAVSGPDDNKYSNTQPYAALPGVTYTVSCEVDRGASGGGAAAVGARIIWTKDGVLHPTQPIGPWALGPDNSKFGSESRRWATGVCPSDANGYYVQLVIEGPGLLPGNYYIRRVKVNRGTGYAWSDEASVSQTFTSIDGLLAQWSVDVQAGNVIGGAKLNATGEAVAFDVLAHRFSVRAPSGPGAKMEWLVDPQGEATIYVDDGAGSTVEIGYLH